MEASRSAEQQQKEDVLVLQSQVTPDSPQLSPSQASPEVIRSCPLSQPFNGGSDDWDAPPPEDTSNANDDDIWGAPGVPWLQSTPRRRQFVHISHPQEDERPRQARRVRVTSQESSPELHPRLPFVSPPQDFMLGMDPTEVQMSSC